MKTITKTFATLAISSVFAFASLSAQAANPFQMMGSASQIAMSDSSSEKCGASKCGASKEEAKCGASKCGASKCGASKPAESKCGASKEASKCGASKCGASK